MSESQKGISLAEDVTSTEQRHKERNIERLIALSATLPPFALGAGYPSPLRFIVARLRNSEQVYIGMERNPLTDQAVIVNLTPYPDQATALLMMDRMCENHHVEVFEVDDITRTDLTA